MRIALAAAAAIVGVAAMAASMAAGATTHATVACDPFTTPATVLPGVRTAQQVLGFPLGAQEVTTAESDAYLAALDADSARVVTGIAATSVQGRPLRYAIVGREANVTSAGLAAIQAAVRQIADPATAPTTAARLVASTPEILWVSGNVHGNEESGTDASLRVLYELAARTDCVADRVLDNAVVVVLPTQNPDGRELDTRRNAYGFDMNRDWFARTQPETDGKVELMRAYPPVLAIDAHEFSFKTYFFPPNADPVHHEVPEQPFGWINGLYGAGIGAEMDRQKIAYFHGSPYDLYAAEYGDTVPTIGLHAAGMTFEKHNGDSAERRTYEHYVAMWTSVFAGATERQRVLGEWRQSFLDARAEGAAGTLEPNAVTFDGKTLYQQVPVATVRSYVLLDDPARARELQSLVRRLQRMDVQVYRLTAPLTVPDLDGFGAPTAAATLPAGTYWIPMAQPRKHWIQAMLAEDPFIPTSFSYDVTSWSNPLLMNLRGGSIGSAVSPPAALVAPLDPPAPPAAPSPLPRIGLFEMPASTTSFQSAGAARYLLDRVWRLPYREVSAADVAAGLPGVDVLLVPDGYVNAGLQALGAKGRKALRDWVAAGGRYVGTVGGAELAVRAGISTVTLAASHTNAPGTLVRVRLATTSPLAAGVGPSVWAMYDDDQVMGAGVGSAVGTFPAAGDADHGASGLTIGLDELAGTAAVVDERVGAGRAVLFSFDPNFRAWTDGTQRILWNALLGPAPTTAAVPDATRAAALRTAEAAAKALPDVGKAIRIAVAPGDADAAAGVIAGYTGDARRSDRRDRTLFVIPNRDALSLEDHPFAGALMRQLSATVPVIAASVP